MPLRQSAPFGLVGAPFGMPYSTAVADRDRERWRYHLDLLHSSAALIAELQNAAPDPSFPVFDGPNNCSPHC